MAGEKEKVSRISPVPPGNVELGETGDVWENREKAFWKCGTSGNWGYPGK